MLTVQRRDFMLVLAAGGAMITLTACDRMPDEAVMGWQGPESGQADPRLRALAWAMLAPSPHNLQPWIADIRNPGLIELYVDLKRLLPQTDPSNRQILISCGAFLELLRMAARQDGYSVGIELMPQGDYIDAGVDQRPFAHVRLERHPQVERDPLFAAVRARRTNRRPYSALVPDTKALQTLAIAAERPGISLAAATSPDQVQRIRELAIQGYRLEFTNQATWTESADLVRLGAAAVAAEPSGLPALGAKVWWARSFGFLNRESLRKTDGYAAQYALNNAIEAAQHTCSWIWLTTSDNSRRTQIEVGRAYMRVDLAAAMLNLAIHPNSQVLQEFAEMQALFQAFHREVGIAEPARVQMLTRIGFAERPDPAPRRALARIVRA
jgi:hypothetical protein